MNNKFYGKFRGIVTDINDPLNIGRLKAKVPDVMGEQDSGWAMPCVPYGGSNMGFFALPVVGAGVWIEFEQGDTEYPIWSGCWWGTLNELPSILLAPVPYKKMLIKTEGGNTIILDDTPTGGISLETSNGQKFVMDATGIEINNGKGASIKMTGPKVTINDDALDII